MPPPPPEPPAPPPPNAVPPIAPPVPIVPEDVLAFCPAEELPPDAPPPPPPPGASMYGSEPTVPTVVRPPLPPAAPLEATPLPAAPTVVERVVTPETSTDSWRIRYPLPPPPPYTAAVFVEPPPPPPPVAVTATMATPSGTYQVPLALKICDRSARLGKSAILNPPVVFHRPSNRCRCFRRTDVSPLGARYNHVTGRCRGQHPALLGVLLQEPRLAH